VRSRAWGNPIGTSIEKEIGVLFGKGMVPHKWTLLVSLFITKLLDAYVTIFFW